MKIQKLVIAVVASTVILLLLDWLWYGMIMKGSMTMPNERVNAAGEPAPDMLWMVLSYIVFSVGFVTIYIKYNGGGSKVNSGLNFGLLVGLMVGLAMNLLWYGLSTMMELSQVLTDAVYSIVKYIILGIAVAYLTAESGVRGGGGKTPG